MIPVSVLDLSPITQGGSAAQSLRNTLDLARHAERWGYRRYWLAEHHNIPAVASAATSIVIAHVAGGTSTIRVGAGGIMLPNHSPLVIAEQFGTLESLFPGRIDLGVGRAPGTDPITAMALRRNTNADTFPEDVVELLAYFREAVRGQKVKAVPGAGLNVPVWILGSSLFGAQLAAELGLPYAFASHFAPAQMMPAIQIYRSMFRPSEYLDQSRLMLGLNVVAADSDDEAHRLFTSHQQMALGLRRGELGPLPPPVDPNHFQSGLTATERAELQSRLSAAVVGAPETVRAGVADFIRRTSPDELIVAGQIFDHSARVYSYEILKEVTAPLPSAAQSEIQPVSEF